MAEAMQGVGAGSGDRLPIPAVTTWRSERFLGKFPRRVGGLSSVKSGGFPPSPTHFFLGLLTLARSGHHFKDMLTMSQVPSFPGVVAGQGVFWE